MNLEVGTQLGIYTVVGPLGAGGMGEVYRATDTKLDREVALKVLPDSMAGDSERVARFQREAKLLASLNHPHIAAIYGFEEAAGKRLLVLELVDGPTLHDRLKAGPLMVEESLDIARQIAEALEAAHERGIVHRDLKPANIKLTPDGKVKVLDFGLAKALVDEDASADPTSSPTITEHFTQPGVILGTAAYMSPEQARGRLVDKRTDIWAFGCVLYECLTGISIFAGETVTDSVGAVLHKQPEWDKLPPGTPPTVQLLLRRCLAKDRQRRLRDIGDVRIELEAAVADPTSSVLGLASEALKADIRSSFWSLRGMAAIFAAMLVGAVVLLGVGWFYWPAPPRLPVLRLAIALPQRESQTFPWLPSFDVSADGSLLAYTAWGNEGKLYFRPMDKPTPTPLPGTEYGYLPVISPDGEWVYYETSQDSAEAAGLSIYRRRADRSGEAELIFSQPRPGSLECARPNGRQLLINEHPSEDSSSGSSRDIAVIVIGPEEEEPQRTAWLDTAFDEWSPAISPDGRWVAFVSQETGEGQVYVRPFEGPGASQQVSRDGGRMPFWSPDGNTLYFLDNRQDALMAAKVTSRATEEATPSPRVTIESREKVFDLPSGVWRISARPDGEGFFATGLATSAGETAEQDDPAVIHVMLNAFERLKQIAPVPEEARP